jgi:hypothetical protein
MESFESESVDSFLHFLISKQDNFGGWANNIGESRVTIFQVVQFVSKVVSLTT